MRSEAGEKPVDAVEFLPIEQHITAPTEDGGSTAVSADEIGRGGAETATDGARDPAPITLKRPADAK